jgi:hypothetical protein
LITKTSLKIDNIFTNCYIIKIRIINNIDNCTICLNDINITDNNIIKLNCGHLFHFICCFNSLNYNNKCPLCRQNIISDHLINNMRSLHNINFNIQQRIHTTSEQFDLNNKILNILNEQQDNRSSQFIQRNIYDLCIQFSSELMRDDNFTNPARILINNQIEHQNIIRPPVRGVNFCNDFVYLLWILCLVALYFI